MAQATSNIVSPKQGALNNKINPSPFGYAGAPISPFQSGNFQTLSGQNTTAAMPSLSQFTALGAKAKTTAPAPAAPVKKVTTNNIDGSSNVTEYHAPADTQPTQNKVATTNAPKTGIAPSPLPTYSGLVGNLVNASSPNTTQTGLVQNLTDTAKGNAAIAENARRIAEGYGEKIAQVGGLGAGAVAGDLSTGTNVVGSGNAAIASQSASQRMAALSAAEQAALAGTGQQLTAQNQQAGAFNSALGGANTQQGQQITGLGNAAGYAQPIQLPYSNQFVDPITGQPVGGGATGNLQNSVSQVAQRIQSGQMSYDQGVQALSGYGQGGVNALQQSLGPGFNVNQSNVLANQQATIGPAYNFAKSALTNLQSIVTKLGVAQGTNIPIINALGNLFSSTTGIGSDNTRQYQGALAEARNAYAQLLAASRGGTPTDYGNQATAAIPDNATPNDIQAAINNLESLGGAKLQIYGNPGQVTPNTGTQAQGGSLFSW